MPHTTSILSNFHNRPRWGTPCQVFGKTDKRTIARQITNRNYRS